VWNPELVRALWGRHKTVALAGNFNVYNFKIGSINYSYCCVMVQVDNINKH
jgi:hypothetical protein